MSTTTTMTTATMTPCAICGEIVPSGASAHEQCGGYLPDNPREYTLWAARHLEKQLSPIRLPNNQLKQRPRTIEQVRARMRPEYRGRVFEWALELLHGAGKITYAADKIRLAPAKRVLRRPVCDDGSADGLFPMPERVAKT